MADRVLHERLQDQMRHEREASGGLHLETHCEPLAEARALNVEVRIEARELLVQRNLVLASPLERQSQ